MARYVSTLLQKNTYICINSLQSCLALTHTFTQLIFHAVGLKEPAGPTLMIINIEKYFFQVLTFKSINNKKSIQTFSLKNLA
jgi:hypothetical protein